MTPISVSKDLVDQIIIRDRFHSKDDVYGQK